MEGMSAPSRLAHLTRAFDQAGGTSAKVLIRRVWLGSVQSELVDSQRAIYESYAAGSFGEDQTIACDDPDDMAERLAATVQVVGADRRSTSGCSCPACRPSRSASRSHGSGPPSSRRCQKVGPCLGEAPRDYRIGVQPLEEAVPPSTSEA